MTTYTCNLDVFGLSTLDLAFDSLAPVGGVLLGCDGQGFFMLDAETDEGVAIPFEVQTGWTDGVGLIPDRYSPYSMKRVGELFLEGSRCDRVLVEFQTPADKGIYPAKFYRHPVTPAGAPVPARVVPGKGLRSVWWRFRLFGDAGGGVAIRQAVGSFLLSNRRV